MKNNIHPTYGKVAFRDSNSQKVYLIGSTMTSEQTLIIDGVSYPLVSVDTSSSTHPFYTGKQRFTQSEGQIAKFIKKYGNKQ